MIRIILLVASLLTLNIGANELITSVEMKRALGKIVIMQDRMDYESSLMKDDMKNQKSKVKQLRRELDELKLMKRRSMQSAVVVAGMLNIRYQPTNTSKVIRILESCSKVRISECSKKDDNNYWCRLENGGYASSKYLSFSSTTVKAKKNYAIRAGVSNGESSIVANTNNIQNITVLGITLNKKWACIDDKVMVSTKSIPEFQEKINILKGK